MLYVLICEDKPDSLELRQSLRPQHLEHIGNYDIRFAGPMLADDEETMIGSIIVLEAPDRAAAEVFSKSDPYLAGGLFNTVTISAFRQVVPA